MATVPFTDLSAMATEVWPSIEASYLTCLQGANYIGGAPVAEFEREWAGYCQAEHAVGVGNGTDALELTLTALGIGQGAEVIVPANTFIATAAAVVRAGAVPRFADVNEETLLMTPATLTAAMTPRTRAVIVVHLYGQMPDMDGLLRAADDAGILVIEDAAQAHGAEWAGRRAGSFGVAACFSFYPGKNLGAFGDAGAVVTSRPELAHQVRTLANHGRWNGSSHYEHEYVGMNSRLDTLQAVALLGKLGRLDAWTNRRAEIAARYRDRLSRHRHPDARSRAAGAPCVPPTRRPGTREGHGAGRTRAQGRPDWHPLPGSLPPAAAAGPLRGDPAAGSRTGGGGAGVTTDVPAHDG